ncbi:HlyD family type I secretion periplasmic adaptor subunit [Piscinibacter sp. HJYY11]|uniref:HlyD family type I secretion periplasmic adaptor subunit n=1 Tax=Piscinibacter sp. HJYY11 TaxID=2801333 RepID=UPI00191FF9B2|nr:HlyD family type I secretion periplasmic adaptor subunit [Piscinibacter sp. HJYY11]MBL0727350.1 HlyD family type I secretion periplasmic adaptor subunit [Piscinibacter sp. HJYY11]
MAFWKRKPKDPSGQEMAYVADVRAAMVVDSLPGTNLTLYLIAVILVAGVAWAALAKVDEITRADGRVVPEGREQVIASLEGGILRELHVREGTQVFEGQELAQLDPTRFESQQNEGEAKRVALLATIARLTAEANGRALKFPDEVKAVASLVEAETDSFNARKLALDEALHTNARNVQLLMKELGVSEAMSAKGLMSEVEVMRLRRQVNDLQLNARERINKFRQDASGELVRAQTELSLLDEQLAGRADVLRRTVLTSPVRGLVKNIRINTIGGVVGPGAAIMEIVPIGSRVLVEARLKPSDVGFVRVGQKAEVKLAAYDYNTYGGLHGKIEYISPDALGEADKGTPDSTYYRVMMRSDRSTLKDKSGKALPILPGMTAQVEVRTGERSVLSFILRPMLKSKEAFRER